MRTLTLAGCLVLLCTCTVAYADDKAEPKQTAEQKALDASIRKSLFDVTDYGAKLHNSGDVAGGYRVFQGGLISVRPLLNHHPEFQAYIREGLNAADRMPDVEKSSFKLRAILDNVREGLKTGELPAESKPLWTRLGGEKGVTKIVDDFITLAAEDQKANFTRNGKYKIDKAKLSAALVAQFSSLTGGPLKYDKDMKAVHKELNITNAEFDAALDDLQRALRMNRVPRDDIQAVLDTVAELRKDIVSAKPAPALKTVWDRVGGEPGVTKIVEDFVALAKDDKAVNFDRGGKVKLDDETLTKIKKELVKQFSYLNNGPYKEEKDVPPPYKGLGITDAEFDAAAKDLEKALEKNSVSSADVLAIKFAVAGIRDAVVEGKPVEPKPALWKTLGGDKGVEKIVDDYYAVAAKNPKANLDKGGTLKLEGVVVEKIKKQMTAQVAGATGGPAIGEIKPFDKDAKLTDEEFTARKDALKESLGKHEVKADDAKAILDAFEQYRKDAVESKKPDDKKEGEVSGAVTVDGKPLESGKIGFVFIADKKEDKKDPIVGDIKDGKYKVTGVKPGMYRVTVKGGDEIGAQYGSEFTTPLKIEIMKDKEMVDLALKGKK
jgi:hemoglobin